MKSQQLLSLPLAQHEHDYRNEQTMRRTVEQGYQDLRNDVVLIDMKRSASESLALRRFQFLLMGASSG